MGDPAPNTPEYFDMLYEKQVSGDPESCGRTYAELIAATEGPEANNPKFLWRLARACFDMQDCNLSDTEVCQQKIREGIAAADRGVEADPDCGFALKWVAIMCGTLNPYLGMSEQIANGHKIKEHADKASKLRPEDATIFIILGEFCMAVAGIGWMMRKAAAVIFGEPPEATWEEALGHCTKAAELEMKMPAADEDPNKVGQLQARTALNCAKCCVQLKKNDEAKMWYETAMKTNPVSETDRNFQNEAKEALAKM